MWLRECYIILVVCTVIYAASVPRNVANTGDDSTTARLTKDIVVFEEEGANNVVENFDGLPDEIRPDNSGSLGGFPSLPADNVQPTSQPGNPAVTQAPGNPPSSVTPLHPNHHPFFVKPRFVEFIEKLREAASETARENQERWRHKMQVLNELGANLLKAGREVIDSGIVFGNTFPRLGEKLHQKLNENRETGKDVDEFTP